MYLPILGSSDRGMGPQEDKLGDLKKPSAPTPPRTKGLSYPGPQPILSDPPEPTNRIQTLLQPALENPPILKPPMALPNLVRMAETGLIPPLEPTSPAIKPPDAVEPVENRTVKSSDVQPEMKVAEALPVELVPTAIDVPKVLPSGISQIAPMPETKFQVSPPAVESKTATPAGQDISPTKEANSTIEKPKEAPAPEISPSTGRGNDMRDLLALTPIPALLEQPVRVPAGEARGRFAVSPEPNLAGTETEPGSKLEIPSAAAVNGIHQAAPEVNGAASDAGRAPTTDTPASAGATREGNPAGGGTGVATAAGSREGSTPGTGSGSGAGSGPVRKPFAGITIVGGVGPATALYAPPPRPLQTAYGVSIISTESSGGGLPFLGVFSNEQVYTVYLDMRRTVADPPYSWTLEFAVLRGSAGQTNSADSPIRNQQGLILPFPAVKELPELSPELARKYERRMVIVYAITNIEGKLEQMSVKETPDSQLTEPVLNALSKWVFRPAQLNGEPVPMKVLLGIPLRVIEQK